MSDEGHPDWIDKLVKVAGALGMNQTRVRWKLIRWHERRRRATRRFEQTVDHVRYEHKTCDECGSVQDREATTCSRCGAKLGKRGFQVLRRLGFAMPQALSVSTLVALAIMAVYVRVFIAQGGGFGAPSGWLLFDFGAQWPLGSDDAWRLVTAMFLHIGMWHLAFNLIAIATIGPQIEELYGRLTMLVIFIATGVLANVGSGWIQPEVLSAGASGGVCGLIGSAAGHGHRLGTARGRTLRDDMLKWLAYTAIFGFVVRANNWAHLFGALTGALLGYAISPMTWTRRAWLPIRAVMKLAGVLVAAGALALILTRKPQEHHEGPVYSMEEDYRYYAALCRHHFDGHHEAAQVMYRVKLAVQDIHARASEDDVRELCRSLVSTRDQCRAGPPPDLPAEAREAAREMCDLMERQLGNLP